MTQAEHLTTFLALPSVDLAESGPFSELHVGVDLDQRDSVFHAQGSNQLLVHGLVAVFGKNAQEGLAFVQGLGSLAESAGKSISDEGLLEDFLDGGVNVHGPAGRGGSRGDISFNITHVDLLDVP